MNVSFRWLQSLSPGITESPRALADRLAMLGAPVDEIVDLGSELGDIVIAQVNDVRPHPNADRLRLCVVDAGGNETLQVVCGAPNVEAGAYYPFAPIGATLPGGITIRKAKLRGEVSEGMLCSPRELGLGRDHEGLMTLHGQWSPGAPLVESIGLDDVRLVIDVTPNRPDLLSHIGVAREVALGGADAIELPRVPDGRSVEFEIRSAACEGEVGGVAVSIEDPAGCPRYLASVIRGVRVGASPEWLASRLRAVGLRPINNVVDATNYVLFELGQPLHAFDLSRLEGGRVRIRRTTQGESIRTLDGVERVLDTDMLVIADASHPVAVAGVMGGADAEVSTGTTDVLLECALFEPRAVRRAAQGLGLSTDASFRFERGVDPEGQPRALERLVNLIATVAGGEVGDALDLTPTPHAPIVVELRPARVAHVLGVELPSEEIAGELRRIGFRVDVTEGAPLKVEVPGFRADITREADLLEEVARRRGYDTFPDVLRPWRQNTVPQDAFVAVEQRVHELFAKWGFFEIRTTPFAPEREGEIPLLNPLSAEESHLRTSLVPGLLRRIERNWAHGNRQIRLYEIGTTFYPAEAGLPTEEIHVATAFTGSRLPPHWSDGAGAWDVWDLKGLLEELAVVLELGRVDPGGFELLDAVTETADRLRLVSPQGKPNGGGGRASADDLDPPPWAEPVWVLEAVLPAAIPDRRTTYRPLPEYPAVGRDLALLVPSAVSAAELRGAILEHSDGALESVEPFDVYTGEGVPEGMRSLAWHLRFRRPDRTLTDAEVDTTVNQILHRLEDRLGVRRR